MIEQTDLVVNDWIYIPPVASTIDKISSDLTVEVMKKAAPTKKGLAFRLTCKFFQGNDTILMYAGQDSYVIDLDDKVDANEILTMIRNSYSKFKEKYEFRKLGTILQNTALPVLNESKLNIEAILGLLE